MDEINGRNMNDIQQLVETTICDKTRDDIVNILERIASLKPPERLLLYMRLPNGAPETDPLRQPQNPLGTRSEINHTINWVRSHLEHDANVSIPKQDVYDDYFSYCTRINIKPLSTADFGKVMKQVFPNIRPRRLGTRGNSRYCYAALRKTTRLAVPALSLPGSSMPPFVCSSSSVVDQSDDSNANQMHGEEQRIVRDWAAKVLNTDFHSTKELSDFIVANHLIENTNRHSKTRPTPKSRACSKEKVINYSNMTDDSATTLNKKRRRKTRNSISSETSRATSPVGDLQNLSVHIKHEPDCAPFSPKGRTTPMSMHNSSYGSSNIPSNGIIQSPLHLKHMKTELMDDSVIEDDPIVPPNHMEKSDEDPIQMQILCKKVRQAQQTKSLWAQRALNLELNSTGDDTLMRPPHPQSRLTNYGGGDGMLKRSIANASAQIGAEKDDVSTDIIIPRERVISICSLDKDALDDYLNGGDNSQDPEAELLQYFQSDENAQNIDTKPSPVLENNHMSNDPNNSKRLGYEKNISELRFYLQQNLQQQQSDAAAARNVPPQYRGLTVVDSKGTTILPGLASATLSKMSANNRQMIQPKRNNNLSVVGSGSSHYPLCISQTQNPNDATIKQPKQTTNSVSNDIPQSPNSRRKNFSFVPISPGPESPSSSGQVTVTGPSSTSQPTIFVSPRSASHHRKSFKQSPSSNQSSTQLQNSNQLTTTLNTNPYTNPIVYSRNQVALSSGPPSPAPLLQMRHEQHMSQMLVQHPSDYQQAKRTTFEGVASEIFGNRSQSAPLHCQMPNAKTQMYNITSSMSCTQSPVPNEYSELMDMVGGSSVVDHHFVKMEQGGATDLSVSSSSLMRTTNMPTMNQHITHLNLGDRDASAFIANSSSMSRSVPSTPQPSQFFGNSGSTPMTMFDISKSVPTTPLANGFCGGNSTPFRYSPSEQMNRDFLINGNTVEPMCAGNNSMSSAFFGSSSQHDSQDNTDQQNSNLSDRVLRIVSDDIDELSSFGDAADPIIGSDLLNQL